MGSNTSNEPWPQTTALRDHIKFARQQMRNVKGLLNHLAPHVITEVHEYGASARYGGNLVHAADVLFPAAREEICLRLDWARILRPKVSGGNRIQRILPTPPQAHRFSSRKPGVTQRLAAMQRDLHKQSSFRVRPGHWTYKSRVPASYCRRTRQGREHSSDCC